MNIYPGVYAASAKVIPNSRGVLKIAVVNTNDADVELKAKSKIGNLKPAWTTIAEISEDEVKQTTRENIVLGEDVPVHERKKITDLIYEFRDVFADNPKNPKRVNNTTHKIITPNTHPVCRKPYPIPYAHREEVDKQVKEMLANDIIRPSKSPWNAPVILVRKKDNSLRFVCDFRSLNDVTVKDAYPLPKIDEIIDKMDDSIIWTTLDAASAYWSIPIEEEDKEKTAFSSPRGKWEFNVTPYGLCNAGATYQRTMDLNLSGLMGMRILAYLDDIIIFSRSYDEHLQQLRELLKCMRKHNISLNLSKCRFAMSQVDFLGYNISKDGVKPQKRLSEAIRNFQRPASKKDLKRFLGMASYYREFIEMFADTASPLHKLTSENIPFVWKDDHEEAFVKSKDALCSYPVLKFPKFGESFTVEVDATT